MTLKQIFTCNSLLLIVYFVQVLVVHPWILNRFSPSKCLLAKDSYDENNPLIEDIGRIPFDDAEFLRDDDSDMSVANFVKVLYKDA